MSTENHSSSTAVKTNENAVQFNTQSETDSLLLDDLGQHPYLYKIYTQICCIFPVHDDSRGSQDKIVNTLRCGLDKLARHFPWIAGDVKYDEADNLYKIRATGEIPFIVNEDRKSVV